MTQPRILKANAFRAAGSKIVFNYDDLRRQCDQYVETTQQQARKLIDEARGEAEQLKADARKLGHEEGRREGLAGAEAEIERRAGELADQRALEKLQTALPAIQQAAESLAQQRDRWLADWERTAVHLAVAVAEKIVRRELGLRPEIGTDLIRAALELAVGSPRVTLRLNPADAELLGNNAEEVVRSMSGCGQAAVASDESISAGGCVIETEHGTIDAQVETQLEQIASELLRRD